MASDTDEDYDCISDTDIFGFEEQQECELTRSTPATTPRTPRTPRPSELKTIPCPYANCSKTFNRNARLQEHINSHTGTRNHQCPHAPCTKAFLRDSHLKHHIKSAHSNVRDYKCTWKGCDKSFATGTRLRRHEAAHEGREKYRCRGYTGCSETFRKHDTLKKHVALVHQQTRPFPCPESDTKTGALCTKAFDTAEKLRAHRRTQHDETRFACTECHQQHEDAFAIRTLHAADDAAMVSFPTYADLQTHIALVHPPTCQYCPASFHTSKELTRHLELVHNITENTSSKSAYTCSYPACNRTFTKKGNRNVHVRTVHEKRREFVCGQTEVSVTLPPGDGPDAEPDGCGRDFTSKSSLEEHIRTSHLGMSSKRMERRKKRKAEKQDDSEDEQLETKVLKRRPRKDKGVKKTTTLQQLTGISLAPARATHALDMLDSQVIADDDQSDGNHLDDDDQDEEGYMSGSVTMYGSQIYHEDTGAQEVHHHPPSDHIPEWETEDFDIEVERMTLDPLLLLS